MEYGNWKNLIYEWIRLTKFVAITSENIEHTNIDQFYEEFRLKLTAHDTVEKSVVDFLRAHYGSFEFHLDDSKEISSLDYVYIYSLLLHFSCVKYPDQYFHNLCQSLDDASQMCIAKFFNLLLVNDKFDRDTIRAAISAARPASLQLLSVDSPIKTPQHTLSPTTPRTMYMEDKRRELILLKAQLDSERYERSVLEMLLKQAEQKINKLGQSQRKYIEEIQVLKNELLSRDTENHSPNKNYLTDQKNHRLQKELLDKEERIIQLQLAIDNLMDDKNAAGEKLALNEKEILHWIDKSRDLEQTTIDLRAELDDRSEKIKCLLETNTELQNFFRETRGGIHGLDSLNTSSCEGLDYSFARITNSSDISTSSPENLGRCVIDIQLKEKEMENNMLRDKLDLLKHDFNRIATEIRNYCNMNSELEPLDTVEPVDEYSLPLKHFQRCKTYFVEKLAISDEFIKNLSVENNKLKDQINEMSEVHDELRVTISKLEHEYKIKEKSFDAKICELQELVLKKTSENTNLFSQLEMQQTDIKSLSTDLDKFTKANRSLENDIIESNATITELKGLCESRYAEIETICCQNDLLRVENKDLISAVTQLESTIDDINRTNSTENTRLTTEIVELSRIVSSVTDENSVAEEKIQQLTQKVFQCGEEAHELRNRINEISEREDRLIEDHQNLMERISNITAEKDLLAKEIIELTGSKCEITEHFEKSISDLQIKKSQVEHNAECLTKVVEQITIEKTTLQHQIAEICDKNLNIVNNLRSEISDLEAKLELLNKSNLETTNALNERSREKSELIEKIAKIEEVEVQSQSRIAEIMAEKSKLAQQVTDFQFDISQMSSEVVNLKLELQALTQINESSNQLNSEHVETISKLQTEISDFTVQIENANTKILTLVSHIEHLDQVNKESLTKTSELANKNVELIEKLAKLEAQIKTLNEINENMTKSNSEYAENLLKLQEERNSISVQLEQANSEINSSIDRIKHLDQIVDKKSTENTTLTNEKVELTSKLVKLQTDYSNSETRTNDLEHEIQTLTETNELAEKSNSENVNLILKLQEDCTKLNTELENTKANHNISLIRISELDHTVNEKCEMLSKMSDEIVNLKNANDVVTKEKYEIVEKFETEIEKLNQLNALAAKSNSQYTDTISKLQEDGHNLSAQLDKANVEIANSVAQIHELSRITDESFAEITCLKSEKDTAMKENHLLSEKLTKFEADCTDSKIQIANMEIEIQRLIQINNSANNSISEYVETIAKLQDEIRNLSVQNGEANAKIESSAVKIRELTFTVDEATSKISEFTEEKSKLNEQLIKLKNICDNSEIQITQLTKENQDLRQSNELSIKSNVEYTEVVSKLKEEISILSNQLDKSKVEIEHTVDEKKKLSNVIDEISTELLNLKSVNDIVTKEKVELIERLNMCQDECVNLKQELQTLNQSNEMSVKSNTEYAETISKLQKDSQKLIDQLDKANLELASSVDQIKELNKIVDQSSSKIIDLANEKIEFVGKYEQLETVCTNSKIHITELKTEIQDLQKLNETTSKSNSEYVETISRLQEESSNLRNQLDTSNVELATSKTRIQEVNEIATKEKSELAENLTKLQTALDTSEIRIAELSTEITNVSNARDEVTTKLEIQISELLIQKDKLVEELRNSTLEVQTLSKATDLATKSNTEFTEIISNIEKSNETLSSELKLANETNSRLCEEFDITKAQVKEVKESHITELAKYESLISELRKEKVELVQTVNNLKENSSKLTLNLERSELQIQQASSTSSELQTKLEKLTEENTEIQSQRSQDAETFIAEISKISSENVKLSEEVTVLQVEIKNLIQSNESQIKELTAKNSELLLDISEQRTNSEKSQETNLRLTEDIFTSESKLKDVAAENKILGDKISALNSEIRVEKDRMLKKVEQLNREIDSLVQNYESIQKEKTDLDVDLKITRSELLSLKDSHSDAHSIKLALIEKEQTINSLEYNLNKLQKDKLEKDKYIENLDQRLSQKEMEISGLMHKLEESCEKDKLLNREKELNEKFTQDIAILKAKLYKHREVSEEREKLWNIEKEQLMAAIEEQKTAEERITENRLELVGKLEKMKTKMKTLYNEEMVKVKTKHENEISDLQKQAKEKFGKYDSHIEKLSKQIYQLNERNLGLEKDNKFLRTKIDFLEINSEATGSTMALNSMGSGGSRNLLQSTNLKMEDEEGEIFNNTYLTDLKTGGRISPTSGGLGRDSVKFTELQHRNSLMPRHLRSTYAAQYGDQDIREEDLKDINFDDSLSSLLYGGQRKKVSGATTYKRPGPPTPSKNAGRLSFGAVTELQAREVLKENNANIPTRLSMTGTVFGGNKRNTPRKLKSLFSSSTSKIKDDFNSGSFDKSVIASKSQLQQLLITSTPRRRSQVNRCRPRLSGHFGICKTQNYSTRQLQMAASIQSAGSIPMFQEHGEWRQTGTIIDSESCTSTSQTGSDYDEPNRDNNTTLKSSTNTTRRRSTKFALKTSTLCRSRNRYRMKSKENRLENFNRARRSINSFILRKSLLGRTSTVNDEPPDIDSYKLLKDLIDLSSETVTAANFNDDGPSSFTEFEKLSKLKVSEAPFELKTPETISATITKTSSSKKKRTLYSGGVIINRKIPRLSIRIGGYHIFNRDYSNDSTRSFDHTIIHQQNSSYLSRNWSDVRLYWRQCRRRQKIFGVGMAVILFILNLICAVKFLYY